MDSFERFFLTYLDKIVGKLRFFSVQDFISGLEGFEFSRQGLFYLTINTSLTNLPSHSNLSAFHWLASCPIDQFHFFLSFIAPVFWAQWPLPLSSHSLVYTILFIFLFIFCPSFFLIFGSHCIRIYIHKYNTYIYRLWIYNLVFFTLFLSEISQVDQDKEISSETKNLVLDGGFVVPKTVPNNTELAAEDLVSNNDFLAPEINSFGHSFRSSKIKIYICFILLLALLVSGLASVEWILAWNSDG